MAVRPPSPGFDACSRAIAALPNTHGRELAQWLRGHLFDEVLPFWERHARDPRGGILTCLADDGRVLSTEKWLWSQWRAVWVFSRIYNRLDRDERWVTWAREIAEFCLRHGWDEKTHGWALVLDREGRILRGNESTYSDAFAVYGLQELYVATGDARHLAAARRTADAALARLAQPYDRIPHFPYALPAGAKPHGIPMLWSLSLAELGATAGEERYLARAATLADEIFTHHHRREHDALIEFVALDGSAFPPPRGTVIVPGHAIEDMWFQFHVAQLTGRGAARTPEIFRLILRHLELGWDHARGGGIVLALDAHGASDVGWEFADTKLWWPHTEALYATLLGWRHTRDPRFLDWYRRVWDVCLEHFVDRTHGEWRQKLDRDFRPVDQVVALPVKDPFHLPRSLILQLELLAENDPSSASPGASARP